MDELMISEKRRFPRAPFDGEAHLEIQGRLFSVEVIDLSLRGALINEPSGFPLPQGETASLKLLMEDSDIRILLPCKVVRTNKGMAGMAFTTIDVESMQHLRRLLALHLGEDDGMDALWLLEDS
ncbi:MAG: PilZ domain-containing protein [Alcanivorax sp.]|nr:PilZ domain-containing protein [Alcanivorax sp.]